MMVKGAANKMEGNKKREAGSGRRQSAGKLRVLTPMIIALLLIMGFQVYWLNDTYKREKVTLEDRTSLLFRDLMRGLQDSILGQRLSLMNIDTHAAVKPRINKKNLVSVRMKNPGNRRSGKRDSLLLKPVSQPDPQGYESVEDDGRRNVINILRVAAQGDSTGTRADTNFVYIRPGMAGRGPMVNIDDSADPGKIRVKFSTLTLNDNGGRRMVIRLDSVIKEKIPDTLIRTSFQAVLDKEDINVPFSVVEKQKELSTENNRFSGGDGLFQGYSIILGSTFPYLLGQLFWPIVFSVFLVALTVFSFVMMYRSLLRQYRLSQIRNDLISNITHELKTPIATVGVAIEALKNFNAMNDTRRTEEYLDISQQELQRLGLLVDKVLNFSMFENQRIELKKEPFDLEVLVREVTGSLRLQLEKQHAVINFRLGKGIVIEGDRLHLLSVVFNLLDNALKYSGESPLIEISTKDLGNSVELMIKDNGIGIPAVYRDKVFEKFFRVPQGATHNAKGHGLGLSYVAQVVQQHGGTIQVESTLGEGSTFTIILPKK
ncbi:MAG: HAMP domain-containing sensor histidine kinase [Chitinophagaceae bacterium]